MMRVQIVPYWNWNKEVSKDGEITPSVQIVPYWNWNSETRKLKNRRRMFKLYLTGIETFFRPANTCPCYRSNCTLLELKLTIAAYRHFVNFSSNCTLLELKLMSFKPATRGLNVQIVPYWNWNPQQIRLGPKKASCSNCTLLELKPLLPLVRCHPLSCSNCTLLELKQKIE